MSGLTQRALRRKGDRCSVFVGGSMWMEGERQEVKVYLRSLKVAMLGGNGSKDLFELET